MTFLKIYEILCDGCGELLTHGYSVNNCKDIVRENNWFTVGKKHYDVKCYLELKKNVERTSQMTSNPSNQPKETIKLSETEENILVELHGDCEFCKGYHFIDDIAPMPELKQAIKHLKELQYIDYYRGLMSEDGEVGGAGWCRSSKGNDYVEEHEL